jgi:hypothetical protein
VELSIGYLQSYEGMGNASATCAGSCECGAITIAANVPSVHESTEHMARLSIKPLAAAPAGVTLPPLNCTITVTMLDTAHHHHHHRHDDHAAPASPPPPPPSDAKFKVTGFMSSYAWAPTPDLHGFAILNKLAKGAMEDGDGRDWFGAWDGKHAKWTISNGGGR